MRRVLAVRGVRRVLGVLGVLGVVVCGAGAQQQLPQPSVRQGSGAQAPQFKSGTQVVEVDVRVFDKDGHFVTDLKPEDFEIKEDGAPQPINTLALVGARGAQPANPTSNPEPSNQTPNLEPRTPNPPATWIFLFDTAHLSDGGLRNAREAVVGFLRERFRDGTLGGVVADGRMANNRMTSVRQELVSAVEGVRLATENQNRLAELREFPRILDENEAFEINDDKSDTAIAITRAVDRACEERPDACISPRGYDIRDMVRNQLVAKASHVVQETSASARASLALVGGLSNGLARLPGTKSVVFITEGFVLKDLDSDLRQATGMANRAGAHLYSIDARGLNRGASSTNLSQSVAGFDSFGGGSHVETREDGMNALAVDTGGMVIRNENNFGRALDEIQRDAGTYYVLGYTPSNQAFDGKYRAIAVTVKRPGMKVRARRGYLAIEPAKLLKPVAITTASPQAAAGSSLAVAPVGSLPGEATAIGSLPAAPPAAVALRSTIESRGFVQELQRSGAERLAPTKADDLAGKGWAAYEKGDVEHASAYLAQAAASPDARPWVRYALGLSHLALERYPDAVRAWEQVRHDVPEFEPVYFNLADGYLLQKDEGAALKVLREAEKRWPQDPEVSDAIGVLQVRRGALDAAVDSFTRATTVAPADSLGYFNLARAYQLRASKSVRYDSTMQKWVGGEGDRKKAQEYYEKYIQMGGPFVQQAKEALAALAWQGS